MPVESSASNPTGVSQERIPKFELLASLLVAKHGLDINRVLYCGRLSRPNISGLNAAVCNRLGSHAKNNRPLRPKAFSEERQSLACPEVMQPGSANLELQMTREEPAIFFRLSGFGLSERPP